MTPKKKKIWKNPRRLLRYLQLRLSRIKATPQSIARGCAIGVFIALMPLAPLRTISCLIFAHIFKASKVSALMSTYVVANPFDILPHYALIYYIGRHISPFHIAPFDPRHVGVGQLLSGGWELLVVLMLGGLVIAPIGALLAYVLSYRLVVKYHKKRQAKLMKQAH